METKWLVTIPNWQNYFEKSKTTLAKYWEWKDKDRLPKKYKSNMSIAPKLIGKKLYCCDINGERFIKNTKKAGKPNIWILNGQCLYNAVIDWRLRKRIAIFYHEYFSDFIKQQISKIDIPEGYSVSTECDIYEIKRGHIPDVDNMWLLEKFFNDSLHLSGIIPDDNPDIMLQSGRKKYYWVNNESERKLIFTITLIKND